jgi:DNA helicase-2/ATP-dependent DNA helicase PcrA
MCVDGVEAGSIVVTTFTEKAARNLEDRLASYLSALQATYPTLSSVDLADLRVGTLHSLCNDIMQEFRYRPYQNVRLLDDTDQALFTYRNADIANCIDVDFWQQFPWLFSVWTGNSGFAPSKWDRVRAAIILFNRIAEDLVVIRRLRAAGGNWARLAGYYEQYRSELIRSYSCDFAHLQVYFIEFLRSPLGARALAGGEYPPILHILVDEYQDTNPIQERIYLALAQNPPHNLTVVGDDDQALYRFRGGTVSCMVNFSTACLTEFSVPPTQLDLARNYRSHPDVVAFFNEYITSFSEMQEPGARAPGKAPVIPSGVISGAYPSVLWIRGNRVTDVATNVAAFVVDHLMADGIITDLSQCLLLFRSTKESPQNSGPFVTALRSRGVAVYNPRSRTFVESEEVQFMLGLLVSLIDPGGHYANSRVRGLRAAVDEWLRVGARLGADSSVPTVETEQYMNQGSVNLAALCAQNPGGSLGLSLLEIAYRMLSREPFRQWRQDSVRNMRLAKVTRLLESYHSIGWDSLTANAAGSGVAEAFLNVFYNQFVGYLISAGVSDEEDEDVIVPMGAIPVMTIHQAKGLEFPVVIAAQVGRSGRVGASQMLEFELAPYRDDLYPRQVMAPTDLAIQDDIRLLYVAYSRAEWALAIAGTQQQLARGVGVPGSDVTAFRRNHRYYPLYDWATGTNCWPDPSACATEHQASLQRDCGRCCLPSVCKAVRCVEGRRICSSGADTAVLRHGHSSGTRSGAWPLSRRAGAIHSRYCSDGCRCPGILPGGGKRPEEQRHPRDQCFVSRAST